VRTLSLSASTAFWVGLLFLMMLAGPHVIPVMPAPEPPEIKGIRVEPAPPEPAQKTIRPRRMDGPEIVASTAPLQTEPAVVIAEPGAPLAVTPSGPPLIVDPVWVRRPSARELARFYPSIALRRGKSGAVRLDCLVRTDGALACRIVEETPEGYGFGDAALRISQTYRMVPAMREGQPIEARYPLRVPFELR
jgi:protein TonB